jgi:hypothetical protein
MAIERMRRVTVLAPSDQLEELLEELQGLGALHLVPLGGEGETPPETQARLTQLRRCLTALRAQADRGKKRRSAPLVASPDLSGLADGEVVARAEAALAAPGARATLPRCSRNARPRSLRRGVRRTCASLRSGPPARVPPAAGRGAEAPPA